MDSSKQRILDRLKLALRQTTEIPYPEIEQEEGVFDTAAEAIDILFATQFKAVGGHFVFCEDSADFIHNLKQLLLHKGWPKIHCWDARLIHLFKRFEFDAYSSEEVIMTPSVGISSCLSLIARTGSILLSSRLAAGRTLSIAPDIHLVFATTQQLVYDIDDALNSQWEKYEQDLPSMLSITTGASRTADIEKTLVMGAHGPCELYVFLLDA